VAESPSDRWLQEMASFDQNKLMALGVILTAALLLI
jgi:hypothetical protein